MRPDQISQVEAKGSPAAKIAENMGGAFMKFQNTVKGLQVNTGDFFLGLASTTIPALQTVVDQLNKLDFTKAGSALGEMVSKLINFYRVFQTVDPAKMLTDSLLSTVSKLIGIEDQFGGTISEKFAKIEEMGRKQKKDALALKTDTVSGLELPVAKGSKIDTTLGLSSLAKLGGGYGGAGSMIPDQAGWESVKIQNNIYGVMQELLRTVKAGGLELGITTGPSSMVLTA
jgi:hypothetical protein